MFHNPPTPDPHEARNAAEAAAHHDLYGPEGPTADDVLDDPADIAYLDRVMSRPLIPIPDPETREAARTLSARDAFVGRPADYVWHPTKRSLLSRATQRPLVALGWRHGHDRAAVYPDYDHLTIQVDSAERLPQATHLAVLVAVQLVRRYGPDAVTIVDADPTIADEPDYWAPLQDAGMRIHPVALDPGRAAGALARAATPVTDALAAPLPRFLVVLQEPLVVPLMSAYGLHGYASAARDALHRIKTNVGEGTILVCVTDTTPATIAVPRPPTVVQAPAPEESRSTAARWRMWIPSHRHHPTEPECEEFELPGTLPPSWWADRLRDPRYRH
ncbi:hypothetical protein ABZ644_25665 [Nocardiopsis alba]|uniref:hypothetical protein n=1 Tax=Nocardiopsis alba TaxID=53437 RepID=UPI0033DBBEED